MRWFMINFTTMKKTSQYRGVYSASIFGRKKWKAQATVKGDTIYLGSYDDEKQAAKMYDMYVIKMNLKRKTNFLKKSI